MPDSRPPAPESDTSFKPTLADQHWRALLRRKTPEEAEKDMLDAVDKGNAWRVNMLLQLDIDWARRDQLMRRIVEQGRLDMFNAITARDPDWHHGANLTMLAGYAAEAGRLPFVKLFVETFKVDIHYYSDELLRNASRNGHEDVVEYLLSKGADHSAWSGTPLRDAAEHGHLGVVKKLVEAGADLKHSYNDPLEYAARGGHVAVAEYLLSKGADPAAGNYDAFMSACRNNKTDMVELFLKHGVDVNARDGDGFIGACESKAFDVAKALLAHGADINAQGGRALRISAYRGETETVKFLLENNASPNARQSNETPLTEAVRSGKTEIVQLLMEHGADHALLQFEAWRIARREHKRDMQHALLEGERAARQRVQDQKYSEFKTTFLPPYSIGDLRERKGPSGETGLLIAARSGKFADLLRGAKGGALLPSDLFHPDDRLDSVMSTMYRNKTLQQFFDPAFWADRTGQVVDAYDSMPPALQKRVKLDAIRAQVNRNLIMQKAKGGGSNGFKPPKIGK